MKIENCPFTVTDWTLVPAEEYPGESGVSSWRTVESGDMRVRLVDYSSGFRSDHWCPRGHILLVLHGSLIIKLKDDREFALNPMMSFQTEDDPHNPHMVFTETGARVFIVD